MNAPISALSTFLEKYSQILTKSFFATHTLKIQNPSINIQTIYPRTHTILNLPSASPPENLPAESLPLLISLLSLKYIQTNFLSSNSSPLIITAKENFFSNQTLTTHLLPLIDFLLKNSLPQLSLLLNHLLSLPTNPSSNPFLPYPLKSKLLSFLTPLLYNHLFSQRPPLEDPQNIPSSLLPFLLSPISPNLPTLPSLLLDHFTLDSPKTFSFLNEILTKITAIQLNLSLKHALFITIFSSLLTKNPLQNQQTTSFLKKLSLQLHKSLPNQTSLSKILSTFSSQHLLPLLFLSHFNFLTSTTIYSIPQFSKLYHNNKKTNQNHSSAKAILLLFSLLSTQNNLIDSPSLSLIIDSLPETTSKKLLLNNLFTLAILIPTNTQSSPDSKEKNLTSLMSLMCKIQPPSQLTQHFTEVCKQNKLLGLPILFATIFSLSSQHKH